MTRIEQGELRHAADPRTCAALTAIATSVKPHAVNSPAVAVAVAVAAVVSGTAVLGAVSFLVIALPLASFARVAISKAALGFGPRLFSFVVAGTHVELKLLPFTSYAQSVGGNPYLDEEPPAPPRLLWPDASPWLRAVVFVIAPRLALLPVPLVVLGPWRTMSAIARGFSDVLSAFSGGGAALVRGAEVLAHEGLLTLFALAVCKASALALLLLPTDLLGIGTRGMATFSKTIAKVRAVVMLATLALWVAWLVAWARWAF